MYISGSLMYSRIETLIIILGITECSKVGVQIVILNTGRLLQSMVLQYMIKFEIKHSVETNVMNDN